MFPKRTILRETKVVLSSALLLVFGACNVDGRWAARMHHQPRSALTGTTRSNLAVDMTIADAREADLVEQLVAHRTAYLNDLRQLKTFYDAHGQATKSGWAGFELEGMKSVEKFRYMMDAEVASDALSPDEDIPEADSLYEKGLNLMQRGGHGVPGIFRRDRMIEAAEVFRDLITRYPHSDKIDDAAFYCGELHKEYLPGQEEIAVKWYERAWTWNPQTEHPARFQAAVVYDYRLHDRDKALELYHNVLKYETNDASNVRFATRRIAELTGTVPGAHLAAP